MVMTLTERGQPSTQPIVILVAFLSLALAGSGSINFNKKTYLLNE